MLFPVIKEPSSPEEYSWEVTLGEGQEPKSIDDRHAGVYYANDSQLAFEITAEIASDAAGSTVPTSLNISAERVIS
jgi:hypothetical protein